MKDQRGLWKEKIKIKLQLSGPVMNILCADPVVFLSASGVLVLLCMVHNRNYLVDAVQSSIGEQKETPNNQTVLKKQSDLSCKAVTGHTLASNDESWDLRE